MFIKVLTTMLVCCIIITERKLSLWKNYLILKLLRLMMMNNQSKLLPLLVGYGCLPWLPLPVFGLLSLASLNKLGTELHFNWLTFFFRCKLRSTRVPPPMTSARKRGSYSPMRSTLGTQIFLPEFFVQSFAVQGSK